MKLIYKPIGQTPLEAIELLRKSDPSLADVRMAYAGRLDPMADGLLVVLVGDECKNRTKYELLDKTYNFTMLLGLSTDTYDILGRITSNQLDEIPADVS